MNWFKKTPKKDDSREKLLEAIEKRGEAADNLMQKIDKLMDERRIQAVPFEGPERRHA